ncbi:DoxX family protein [Dysgonomonas sp. GY617]|uniref:DoxX family protein n=1 Tax=Dysgonomonas sp. GY617 TaxID=2780420 RepID=UPI001883EC2D|nr:DoxX family protein [Dysgonomonas sp. GY617]MBF0577458.1 DoxX family protein [Dysgonomonas sp. GY617]
MGKLISVLHWCAYVYYIYIFGYASLYKVFQKKTMMDSMLSLGFNKPFTIIIGVAELIGVILLLVGFWHHGVRNIGVLFLTPFAIGALTAHFAHQEYNHYYNALICCVLSGFLLLTDKHFQITV